MGFLLGGTGFNITAHHFIYEPLTKMFPRYVFHALTDDLPALIPCPRPGADQDQWEAHYDKVAEFFQAYDELANPIGIFRHEQKCKVLIPTHGQLPL